MPNVILIVADSLRRDALSVYGSHNNTRNIEELARDGVVYTRAISNSGWTLPAYITMLTGQYPSVHKIGTDPEIKLRLLHSRNYSIELRKNNALPSLLKKRGFTTAIFTTNIWISNYTGVTQDFSYVREVWRKIRPSNPIGIYFAMLVLKDKVKKLLEPVMYGFIPRKKIDSANLALRRLVETGIFRLNKKNLMDFGAEATNNSVAEYLNSGRQKKGSSFMLVNYMEPHEYYPLRGTVQNKWFYMSGVLRYDDVIRSRLSQAYRMRVEYLDKKIGELLKTLKEHGLYEDSLIIFLSDHGQQFGEHGVLFHGRLLYEELLRIPLIIKYPACCKPREGKNNDLVELRQIYDLVAAFANKRNQGRNIALKGKKYAISEYFGSAVQDVGDNFLLNENRSSTGKRVFKKKAELDFNSIAFYKSDLKLIVSDSPLQKTLLFDLSKDPQERRNLAYGKKFARIRASMLKELIRKRKGVLFG